MSDPYQFALDIWFKVAETEQPDGEHYLLQWSMAENPGTGWANLPPKDRKGTNGDYGFGDIEFSASKNDEFVVSIFSNDQQAVNESGANIIKSLDWVRLVPRPAHDAPPMDDPPITPFQGNDADAVIKGAMTPSNGVANAYSAGFQATFTCGWASVLGGKLANPPSSGAHFEVEVYLAVTNGDGVQRYYKSDPELIIGKRGG